MAVAFPLDRSHKALAKIESDAVLLIGLLYHGTQQHDVLIMRNIFKDALARAHKVHTVARMKR